MRLYLLNKKIEKAKSLMLKIVKANDVKKTAMPNRYYKVLDRMNQYRTLLNLKLNQVPKEDIDVIDRILYSSKNQKLKESFVLSAIEEYSNKIILEENEILDTEDRQIQNNIIINTKAKDWIAIAKECSYRINYYREKR